MKQPNRRENNSEVRRLSNLAVYESVVENNVNADMELFAKTKEQEASNRDLANLLVSRSSKSLQDLLSNVWNMESSTATLARKAATKVEVVRKCATEECVNPYKQSSNSSAIS